MSLEGWKAFLEIGGVVLLALTVVFGASALIVNNRLNAIQAEQLRQFDKALTDAKSENLKLQTILLPRRIPIRPKEGDRVRIERHAEVVKYSRTYAVIQSVPDFESQILAFDISSALVNAGWATDIVGEDRTHISPRLIKDGVRVITLELYPFTLNSQPRTVAPSKASDAAKALVALLSLDLAPPSGPESLGIRWEPEYSGHSSPIMRGKFKLPDGAVLILVGMKPVDGIFGGRQAAPTVKSK